MHRVGANSSTLIEAGCRVFCCNCNATFRFFCGLYSFCFIKCYARQNGFAWRIYWMKGYYNLEFKRNNSPKNRNTIYIIHNSFYNFLGWIKYKYKRVVLFTVFCISFFRQQAPVVLPHMVWQCYSQKIKLTLFFVLYVHFVEMCNKALFCSEDFKTDFWQLAPSSSIIMYSILHALLL